MPAALCADNWLTDPAFTVSAANADSSWRNALTPTTFDYYTEWGIVRGGTALHDDDVRLDLVGLTGRTGAALCPTVFALTDHNLWSAQAYLVLALYASPARAWPEIADRILAIAPAADDDLLLHLPQGAFYADYNPDGDALATLFALSPFATCPAARIELFIKRRRGAVDNRPPRIGGLYVGAHYEPPHELWQGYDWLEHNPDYDVQQVASHSGELLGRVVRTQATTGRLRLRGLNRAFPTSAAWTAMRTHLREHACYLVPRLQSGTLVAQTHLRAWTTAPPRLRPQPGGLWQLNLDLESRHDRD